MSDLNFENHNLPSVSIVRTTPGISEQQLSSYKRCYIGISLGNPLFQGKSLQAILSWAVERFEQSLVIIGDYLCRFNERILHGLNSEQAAQVAQNLGDDFLKQTKELFEQFPEDKLKPIRWKKCLENVEYMEAKSILDNLFKQNQHFQASVEKDAFSFINRQTKRNETLSVETEEAIKLSCEYLLEEIAVFSALSQQGWHVELYPGAELNVLEDIAKGKYNNIPTGLKKRINIELRIA